MIAANNPNKKSWIEVDLLSEFPIQNIPFSIMKTSNGFAACTRIGDFVINLDFLNKNGFFSDLSSEIFSSEFLNDFLKLRKSVWRSVRNRISDLFDENNNELRSSDLVCSEYILSIDKVQLRMPLKVGDYTDFYSSKEHATNVGTMFRDPNNALLPNWLHIPVGYHGRSSSIVLSGTSINRPKGQYKIEENEQPQFGPCRLLDFELEMAFITGEGKRLGQSISTKEAEDYIFGLVLFNDWSARDIQKWEYVPLGPFLGKSFASSISPWIVTLDALEPFRVKGPIQEPAVLPYLEFDGNKNFDIQLDVTIETSDFVKKVCTSNFKYMYWNMAQQLSHHTVNGCNINAGDMMASGTISGPTSSSFGSMLELSWKGTRPIDMPDGSIRKFILDNDIVRMTAFSSNNNYKIGFGSVMNKVLPAI